MQQAISIKLNLNKKFNKKKYFLYVISN